MSADRVTPLRLTALKHNRSKTSSSHKRRLVFDGMTLWWRKLGSAKRTLPVAEMAALHLGLVAPHQAANRDRLCLSLCLSAAYEEIGQAAAAKPPPPRRTRLDLSFKLSEKAKYEAAAAKPPPPRRTRLDLSFKLSEKAKYEELCGVLAKAIEAKNRSCAADAPWIGARCRLHHFMLATGASGVAESYDAKRGLYLVRLDVVGDLVAVPPSAVEPFANASSSPPAAMSASSLLSPPPVGVLPAVPDEQEQVESEGDADDEDDGGELFHTLASASFSEALSSALGSSPPPPPLAVAVEEDGLKNLSFFASPPDGMEVSEDDIPEMIEEIVEEAEEEAIVQPAAEVGKAEEMRSQDDGRRRLTESIGRLIEGLGLGCDATSDALEAASAWLAAEGYDSSSEIREVGAESDLCNALRLKPGKARLLAKRLAELPLKASVPCGLPVDTLLQAPTSTPLVEAGGARADSPSLDWRLLAHAYEKAETMRLGGWEHHGVALAVH